MIMRSIGEFGMVNLGYSDYRGRFEEHISIPSLFCSSCKIQYDILSDDSDC